MFLHSDSTFGRVGIFLVTLFLMNNLLVLAETIRILWAIFSTVCLAWVSIVFVVHLVWKIATSPIHLCSYDFVFLMPSGTSCRMSFRLIKAC